VDEKEVLEEDRDEDG
jgi:hypothetical protein